MSDSAVISAGPFEYEVYIPEFVRRQLQGKIGDEISLRTGVSRRERPRMVHRGKGRQR